MGARPALEAGRLKNTCANFRNRPLRLRRVGYLPFSTDLPCLNALPGSRIVSCLSLNRRAHQVGPLCVRGGGREVEGRYGAPKPMLRNACGSGQLLGGDVPRFVAGLKLLLGTHGHVEEGRPAGACRPCATWDPLARGPRVAFNERGCAGKPAAALPGSQCPVNPWVGSSGGCPRRPRHRRTWPSSLHGRGTPCRVQHRSAPLCRPSYRR